MCFLPGEVGSVEIVPAGNIKDIAGKWYDVFIDRDAWGAESKPTCSESTISLAPGSKESVPQTNENLHFKRSDFKSQAEGFANFLKPENSG
jgi:hypothetical protein